MGNILDIKDDSLRNVVWNLQKAVEKKAAKKNWQPPPKPPRDPRDAYRGHSQDQIEARKRLDDRIQGEREG